MSFAGKHVEGSCRESLLNRGMIVFNCAPRPSVAKCPFALHFLKGLGDENPKPRNLSSLHFATIP